MSTPTTEAGAATTRRKREKNGAAPPEAAPVAAPIKQRRRPALIGLGVALVALGGVGAAYLATSVSDTQQIIVVRENVPRGTVIEEADLGRADVTADPSIDQVPYDQRDTIVGQVAAFDLVAGTNLTTTSFTAEHVPGEGEAVVPLAANPGQLPSTPLTPGDAVRIVFTPKPQDNAPRDQPQTIDGTVVTAHPDPNSGVTVVDVVLPEGRAEMLATWNATGRIAIILANAPEEG